MFETRGDTHMKRSGMLVVSGANRGSGLTFTCQIILQSALEEIIIKETLSFVFYFQT